MIGRLQFRHDDTLYKSKAEIAKVLDDNVVVTNYPENRALFAEPIVFKYSATGDKYNPNIVIAIGAVGDGTAHKENKYFLIDTATLEQDINDLKEKDVLLGEDVTGINELIEEIQKNLEKETKERKEFDDILMSGVTDLYNLLSAETKNREDEDARLEHDKVSHKNMHFSYDDEKKEIVLSVWYKDGDHIVEEYKETVDCKQFIKDGMLDNVEYISGTRTDDNGNDVTGTWLKLTWNTDAGKKETWLSVSDLIDIYSIDATSVDYLLIKDHKIMVINVDNEKGLASYKKVYELYKELSDKINSDNNDLENRLDDLDKKDTELEGMIKLESLEREKSDLEHDRQIVGLNSGLTHVTSVLSNRITEETTLREVGDKNLEVDKISYKDLLFEYDTVNKVLKMHSNANPGFVREIPISDFIKGGFIQSVKVVSDPDVDGLTPGPYLEILWDTVGGTPSITYIPLDTLVDVYTVAEESETYLTIKKFEIGVKVDTPSGLATVSYVENVKNNLTDTLSEITDVIEGVSEEIENVSLRYSGNTKDIENVKTMALTNTDLSLKYNGSQIQLIGKGGALLSEFDTNEFVKDGMIKDVTIDMDNNLVITWNSDADDKNVKIPLKSFIDIYTVDEDSQKYMSITDYVVRLKVDVDGGLASHQSLHLFEDEVNKEFTRLNDVIIGEGFSGRTITRVIQEIEAQNNEFDRRITEISKKAEKNEKDISVLSSLTDTLREKIFNEKSIGIIIANSINDLIDDAFWKGQGVVLKEGMAVSVKDEKSIYILTDPSKYFLPESWVKVNAQLADDEDIDPEKILIPGYEKDNGEDDNSTMNLLEVIQKLQNEIDFMRNNYIMEIVASDKDMDISVDTEVVTDENTGYTYKRAVISYNSTTN